LWVNIDQYAGIEPDVVAWSDRLPFDDGTAEFVYCGHLLEHLEFYTELPATLQEIRRVLTPDGQVCIVGPDFDRALSNPEWHPLLPCIRDGGDRWPGDRHRWLSSGPKTLKAVERVFPDATEVDITTLDNWPLVDDVGWQFAILAEGER
jgi:SAM-dependent methyltransferase